MTLKLLYQLDTDWTPSVFDSVVAYDGGADQVIGHANVTPERVGAMVEGAIFTRGPKEKRFTALFVGGGNMEAGEAVFTAAQHGFFGGFRVSLMLDSNGANTTAAAAVALLGRHTPLAGLSAVVLAGTGPVGMRAAAMMAMDGAHVAITGRKLEKTQAAAAAITRRFGVPIEAIEAADLPARQQAIRGRNVIFTAGAIAHELIDEASWRAEASVRLLADANAQPPLGIGGIAIADKGTDHDGRAAFGALGIGGLKLRLHRACIERLFVDTKQVLDAEAILALAKELA